MTGNLRAVETGAELFAMTAAMAYAGQLVESGRGDREDLVATVLHFAKLVSGKVEGLFRDVRRNADGEGYRTGLRRECWRGGVGQRRHPPVAKQRNQVQFALMLAWKDICEDRHLRDLPFKIETNRFDQIVMSPAYNWHGSFQYEIGKLLDRHLPGGRIITKCAIETSDGTKVADVAWISRERFHPHRRAYSLPIAPEICVEIMSNSNSKDEMADKMQLYFARGAEEAWLCDEGGNITFFRHDENGPTISKLCPDFPVKMDWE